MVDLLKNAISIGVGIAAMTREKVEEISETVSKEVKITEKEGQKIYDEFLEHVKHSSENLETRIKNTINHTLKSMNIVTKEEVQKANYVTQETLTAANDKTNEEINQLKTQIEELKKIISEK